MNPTNAGFDVKRLIGRRLEDTNERRDMRLFQYKIVTKHSEANVALDVKGERSEFAPEEISATVLAKMKRTAEDDR